LEIYISNILYEVLVDLTTVLKKILGCLKIPFSDATDITLTASIGISIFPKDAQDKQTLMEKD